MDDIEQEKLGAGGGTEGETPGAGIAADTSDLGEVETIAAAGPDEEPGAAVGEESEEGERCEARSVEKEYPEYVKDGRLSLPQDVLALRESGLRTLDACRVADLRRTKKLCERLSAKLEAQAANGANLSASIGSLSGGGAPQKDYYTSKEWDGLSKPQKEKLIKSGKIYEFMRKWSGR